MKARCMWIVIAALLAWPAAGLFANPDSTDAKSPTHAICPVCRAMNGETEPEEVKATRTWKGTTYGFCSEKCAKTFDADPAAYLMAVLPYSAPGFTARTLDGKPLELAAHEGKIVLVDFWATWCAPCLKSMPELQKLHDRYAKDGVVVLGLSVDEDPKQVTKFLKKRKFTYPIALDSADPPAFQTYGVLAVPAAFLVDRQGQVVARWLGRTAPEEIEAEIQKLLDSGS